MYVRQSVRKIASLLLKRDGGGVQVADSAFAAAGAPFNDPALKAANFPEMRNAIMAAATSALASYDKHIKPYVKVLEFARRFHVSSPPVEQAIYDFRFFGVAADQYV